MYDSSAQPSLYGIIWMIYIYLAGATMIYTSDMWCIYWARQTYSLPILLLLINDYSLLIAPVLYVVALYRIKMKVS
jgi:hypothetical protein